MARLTAPLLGFDALGSVAKEVTYSKWKGRNYAKRHRAPANPKTVLQIDARDTLSQANQLWRRGPDLFKAGWDASAAGRALTGYNTWIGRWMSDVHNDTDILNVVMSPQVNGGLGLATLGGVVGFQFIRVDMGVMPTPPGWTVQACVAACFRNGPVNNLPDHLITAGEDTTEPYSVNLSGLTSGVIYGATGWPRYLLPNGKIAYGQAAQIISATPG